MSGAKQKFGLPTGLWVVGGGLAALMLGSLIGRILITTAALDFLLPRAAVSVNVTPDNNGPVPATPMGPSIPAPTTATPPSVSTGKIVPPGNIVVQVAAVTREDYANALANTLKQKGFPAFVNVANDDKLYRVQLGPYTDRQSAQATAFELKRQGLEVFLRSQ